VRAGLSSFATYIPAGVQTSWQISHLSGIPEQVVTEKLGIRSKPRAGPCEQVSEMAAKAARKALGDVDPATLDVVLWTGSEYKDYGIWSAGPKVQHEIGAVNAWATDVASRCASQQVAIKFAKDMLVADPRVNRILLAGGHRMIDKLNYANPRSRFLFNMSDGASAVLIERGDASGRNEILESAFITDGSFADDVMVPGGGTRQPLTKDNFDPSLLQLDVPDPPGMKARLDRVSMRNFTSVVERAVTASGYAIADIGYFAVIHMKRSAHDALLDAFGLCPEQSTYLDQFGHAGAPDVIRSLEIAAADGRLNEGDLVVLAGAGTGYIWAATCLRWGPFAANGAER
jgi:3-oxoacyl-[acyl-carrier-protein] synthase-3